MFLDHTITFRSPCQVLHMELGQRYSVMIRLDQEPGNYYLRFATFPSGDMQQVLEGQAIVSYNVSIPIFDGCQV